MKRLLCWWHGHLIKATIDVASADDDREVRFVFHCERCGRILPGPELQPPKPWPRA